MKQSLAQRQTQSTTLAPKMQQALRILQMSATELEDYLLQEMESNPFLERGESEHYISYYEYNNFEQDLAKVANSNVSLREHLLNQIGISFPNSLDRHIAYLITDYVDENGYLQSNVDDLAQQLHVLPITINGILQELQKLEPTGVYARDLKECLRLQAEERGVANQKFLKVLDNIELVAEHNIAKLAKVCSLPLEQVKEKIEQIQMLDPKPGRNFSEFNARVVIPDVITEKESDIFLTRLNKEVFPILVANSSNVPLAKLKQSDREFIKRKQANANWLVKTLNQRNETVLNVAQTIVDSQYEFMKFGPEYLKPLRLQDIADKLSLHPSTISRVNNKYIQTPHGVFSFKYFFNSSINSSLLEEKYSSVAIQAKIKKLISKETTTLSDAQIAKILDNEGVAISRRTVAKYRELLGIASSSHRRRVNGKK